MKKYKLIILDFDGVIIESVDIKTRAFAAMFADQPEIAKLFMEYHFANNGKSRFNKFEWLYKNILKKPLTDEEKDRLGDKFSKLVFQQVVECPYVEGAIEFLEKYHKTIPLFLASITPQQELEKIISQRSLTKYFKGILGGTGKKTVLINKILRQKNIKPQEALFIGDTKEDYVAAQETGVRFIARTKQELFNNLGVIRINNLIELNRYLGKNCD